MFSFNSATVICEKILPLEESYGDETRAAARPFGDLKAVNISQVMPTKFCMTMQTVVCSRKEMRLSKFSPFREIMQS